MGMMSYVQWLQAMYEQGANVLAEGIGIIALSARVNNPRNDEHTHT